MNRFEFNTGDHKEEEEKVLVGRSYGKEVLYRFRKNKGAWISFFIIILLIVIALAAPAVSSYSYKEVHSEYSNLPPRIPGLEKLGIFDGVSHGQNMYEAKNCTDKYFFFGTDNLGRDIWTRVWEGTRISLLIAALAVIIDVCIGVIYGLVSGYFGGKVDMVMQRILEVANGIPRLVIVTLMLLVFKPGILTIVIALMLTEWIGMSRIARAEMLKLKEQEFVLASRTLGAGSFFIIFKEVLPNIIGPIITQVMFSIPTAIFTEAFLSFVGLGIPVPQCSLGSLISDGFNFFTTHPYQIIPPIIVMALLMLSFNLVADGLREALDPKLKEM